MRRSGAIFLFLALSAAVFLGVFKYGMVREEMRKEAEARTEAIQTKTIQIYTDLPQAIFAVLAPEFEQTRGIRLNVQEMARDKMIQAGKTGQVPDIYIASQRALHLLKEDHVLSPYVSDQTGTVLNRCKDIDGYWTGVWLNPVVFAVNAEFAALHPDFAYLWDEVFSQQDVRLTMTDFIATDFSEESLIALVEHFGREETFQRLRSASSHMVQYGKYLSTPAQMAAMDKCDIGISDLNEAEKVQQEGLPIRIIFPEDGTFYYLYGAALAKEGKQAEAAASFMDWLLNFEGRETLLEQNGYYFIHVNHTRMMKDDSQEKIRFWPIEKRYTEEGKKELLDQWLQEIRFGRDEK